MCAEVGYRGKPARLGLVGVVGIVGIGAGFGALGGIVGIVNKGGGPEVLGGRRRRDEVPVVLDPPVGMNDQRRMALLILGQEPDRPAERERRRRDPGDDFFPDTGFVGRRHVLADAVDGYFSGRVASNKGADAGHRLYVLRHSQSLSILLSSLAMP